MKLTHRHQLLRGSSAYQKLTFEFLFFSMAKNIPYIFLALQLLNIFGVVNFNINPDNFPALSIGGELAKFAELSFNPFLIYWHFITVFFLVVKSVTLTFIGHIRTSPITAGIVAIIVANIFLLYRSLSYGAAREHWNKRSIFKWMFSDILKGGNLLDDALFMMFVVDIIVFVTNPERSHLYFIIAVYLVMLSIKITPIFANLASNFFNAIEQSFFHNKKVLFAVTLIDILMVYLDSQNMFTLFLLILAYTAIATLILRLTKKFESANEILYYLLYLGLLVFYLSVAAILAVSLAVVLVAQIPIIILYYLLKKKLSPGWLIQIVNGLFLVILLFLAF